MIAVYMGYVGVYVSGTCHLKCEMVYSEWHFSRIEFAVIFFLFALEDTFRNFSSLSRDYIYESLLTFDIIRVPCFTCVRTNTNAIYLSLACSSPLSDSSLHLLCFIYGKVLISSFCSLYNWVHVKIL